MHHKCTGFRGITESPCTQHETPHIYSMYCILVQYEVFFLSFGIKQDCFQYPSLD